MHLVIVLLWAIFTEKCNTNDENTNINLPEFENNDQHKALKTEDPTVDDEEPSDRGNKTFPRIFDARLHWPHCKSIGDVKNQGSCKSGWAIAVASVVTDRQCIQKGHQVDDLSAYNLLSCCDDCCGCNGGNILKAWEYVKYEGLLTGGSYKSLKGCQPYMIRPCNGKNKSFNLCGWKSNEVPECNALKCTNNIDKKMNYYGYKQRIMDYQLLPRAKPDIVMKELYTNGPIQVSMELFDDFRWHKQGAYIHSKGKWEGDHAVKLIGWDDQNNWLLINSFGKFWGNGGTFLISQNHKLSDCSFGFAMVVPKFHGETLLVSNAISRLAFVCKLHIYLWLVKIYF